MHAVILGGTGAIGGATAARLAAHGWEVDVTGRDHGRMPAELETAGVRFHRVERGDIEGIARLVGDGADLLVDAVAYGPTDVRGLLPVMAKAASCVLISSRAVYVDTQGRHINGELAPRFEGTVNEHTPTLPPGSDDIDPFTRAGYAPAKVGAERVALDSGFPVTVVRPAKVHGRWARNPRTRTMVERMLGGERAIALADRGQSIDHLSAAANTASLIEVVALHPGARILNSADPDTPDAVQIARAIGDAVGWTGDLDLLPPGVPGGAHPWYVAHPFILDTSAATALGYTPMGTSLALLVDEVDWIARTLPGQ